jgi:hypothetical protein
MGTGKKMLEVNVCGVAVCKDIILEDFDGVVGRGEGARHRSVQAFIRGSLEHVIDAGGDVKAGGGNR